MKRENDNLFISPRELPRRDKIQMDNAELKARLKKHFRGHIGREEATNPRAIFREVMFQDAYTMDPFKRAYYWNYLKKLIQGFRKGNELFIVHRDSKYFVLKSVEEAADYKVSMEKSKHNIDESVRKAEDWVKEKKWKNF